MWVRMGPPRLFCVYRNEQERTLDLLLRTVASWSAGGSAAIGGYVDCRVMIESRLVGTARRSAFVYGDGK
jgi:hypothetical protein